MSVAEGLPASSDTAPSVRDLADGRDGASSTLPVMFRTSGLLLIESLSVGLALWATRAETRLGPYVTGNALSARGRSYLLADMLGLATLTFLVSAVFLVVRRRPGLALLERAARRLAPLAMTGAIPFLLRWQLWSDGRNLPFLVLAALFALGTHAAILMSLRAGPVLDGAVGEALASLRRTYRAELLRAERWAPAAMVGCAVVWYAVFFSYYTVANHHNLRTASLDLGLENNLIWNLVHGGPFMKSSPLMGPTGSHFGFHATFFSYVIGLFYLLAQRPETLLVFQASMIALAAVPLYLFASRHLGKWAGAVIAVCYILYPPVHGSNLYDFHYLPLGPVFLWLTLWLLETRRDVWAAVAVVLTLSVREDIACGLVIVGAYLVLSGVRPRAGAVVATVAAAYFVLLKGVAMPRALHGASSFIHQYAGLLPSGEHTFGSVMKTVIGNPAFTLGTLLELDKLIYVLQIAVPLCFLPWRSAMGFLCSLPGFLFTLLSTQYPPLVQISFQYTAHWTAYLFIALVWNLERIGAAGDRDSVLRRRAWMAALVAAIVVTTHQYGAMLQQNTARGGFGTYVFRTSDTDRERYKTLKEVIRTIPPQAKIVSSENLVPHVSERVDSYTLREGLFDAEYLLVMMPARGDESPFVRQALQSGEFGVVTVREPFLLARRGYSTKGNAAVQGRF